MEIKPLNEIIVPRRIARINGFFENEIIAVFEKANIFLRGYFVSPANLFFLS